MRNRPSKITHNNWHAPVYSRRIPVEGWKDSTPKAGITKAGVANYLPWSSNDPELQEEGGLVFTRLLLRLRRDRILLLTVAAALILTIAFFAILISKSHAAGPVEQVAPPAEGEISPAALVATENAIINKPVPSGQTHILLLGSDQRPDDSGYRTDAIILLTLDPDQGTVSAVSFPRDLWVKVPALYEMKINQVFALGGFDAMAGLFEANFGIKPDYYVMTNFSGFSQFIDDQGGVDVEVGQELTDTCDLPQQVNDNCTVEPGVVRMDGPTALWYVRSRYTTSDYDRLRRIQEVLYAIFKKMVNINIISKLSEIQAVLGENVQTNMNLDQAMSYFPFALRLLRTPNQIHRFAITEDQAYPSWSWNGMWILLPDTEAIQALLHEAGIKP